MKLGVLASMEMLNLLYYYFIFQVKGTLLAKQIYCVMPSKGLRGQCMTSLFAIIHFHLEESLRLLVVTLNSVCHVLSSTKNAWKSGCCSPIYSFQAFKGAFP